MDNPTISEPTLARKPPPSIFGIISTGVGLISATMVCGGIALLVFLAMQNRGAFRTSAPDALLTALCVVGGGPLAILGVGLGIGGLFEEKRSRVFSIVGIAANALALLILAAIVALGLIARGRGLPPNL